MKKWLQLSVLCVVVAVVWGEYSLVQAQTSDLKPKLATSIGEIAGTWFTKDCYFYPGCYLRIDKDGTGRQARAPDKLDNEPYARNSFEFKGTEMAVTEVSVSADISPSGKLCGKAIGRYQVQLLENGNIRIVLVEDQCPQRKGDFQGGYSSVP
jgi:hypothetical protein